MRAAEAMVHGARHGALYVQHCRLPAADIGVGSQHGVEVSYRGRGVCDCPHEWFNGTSSHLLPQPVQMPKYLLSHSWPCLVEVIKNFANFFLVF